MRPDIFHMLHHSRTAHSYSSESAHGATNTVLVTLHARYVSDYIWDKKVCLHALENIKTLEGHAVRGKALVQTLSRAIYKQGFGRTEGSQFKMKQNYINNCFQKHISNFVIHMHFMLLHNLCAATLFAIVISIVWLAGTASIAETQASLIIKFNCISKAKK